MQHELIILSFACMKSRYNLCKNMRFCSSAKTFPHLDGTLQTKINHPAHLLHPSVSLLLSLVLGETFADSRVAFVGYRTTSP